MDSRRQAFHGKRILISVGPMRTAIDPVRFIQNRSSGKMGLALAQSCAQQGASVTVLLGPVSPEMRQAFKAFKIYSYEGPEEYGRHLSELFPQSDTFFSAAAVLDFGIKSAETKIPRSQLEKSSALTFQSYAVPDFVKRCGHEKRAGQVVIAFAAETGTEKEILDKAGKKRLEKKADFMIANPVWEGLGPESENNLVWILSGKSETKKIGPDRKESLSEPILEFISQNVE